MPDAFLTPALSQLRDEIDAMAPNRDKKSDGWIGDPLQGRPRPGAFGRDTRYGLEGSGYAASSLARRALRSPALHLSGPKRMCGWTQIGRYPMGNLDTITTISGDMDEYGKVYVGFGGSGYAYLKFDTAPVSQLSLHPANDFNGDGRSDVLWTNDAGFVIEFAPPVRA